MGSKPETFEDWFWKPLNSISAVLIGVIITIGMAIAALVMLIVDFVAEIFLEILPILGYILWLIIRVLILIFIWILFAFTFLFTIITYGLIAGMVFTLNIFMNLDIQFTTSNISVKGDINLEYNYSIEFIYCNFLDFYIPTISIYLNFSGLVVGFYLNFFLLNFGIIEFPEEIITDVLGGDSAQSSNISPKASNNNDDIYFERFMDVISGMGFTMTLIGGIVSFFAGILSFTNDHIILQIVFLTGIVLLFTSLFFIIRSIILEPERLTDSYLLGMALGCLISAIVILDTGDYMLNKGWYMAKFLFSASMLLILGFIDIIIAGFDIGFGLLEIYTDIDNNDNYNSGMAIFSLCTGLFAMILTSGTLVFLDLSNRNKKNNVCNIFGGLSIVFAGILIAFLLCRNYL